MGSVLLLLGLEPRLSPFAPGSFTGHMHQHLLVGMYAPIGLVLGGLAALHLTPLYDATVASPLLHHAVHAHFLAAGHLFARVVAGPDPAPRRPSVPVRLVVLGVAIVGHAVLSQLLYAGALVQVSVLADDRRTGAELTYHGGDIAELALAVALVTTWRPRRAAPTTPVVPAAGRWRAPVRGSSRPGPVVSP